MKGSNHIVTGISSAIIIDTCVKIVSALSGKGFYENLHGSNVFKGFSEASSGNLILSAASAAICAALFLTGCLLPDIDQKTSILGRFCHIPVAHRTWTHTIWAIMLLGVISLCVPKLMWLTYGYTLHIFLTAYPVEVFAGFILSQGTKNGRLAHR